MYCPTPIPGNLPDSFAPYLWIMGRMTPIKQALSHYRDGGKACTDSSQTLRSAILLHDDEKGLIEAVVFFEGGGTAIEHFFPPSVDTMTYRLKEAKQALVRIYQLLPENIQTHMASLDPHNPQTKSAA